MPSKTSAKAAVNYESATPNQILSAIRNSASDNYRNAVPATINNLEELRAIGNVITQNPSLKNEFLNIANRIAKVIVTSKSFSNPWAVFKKGLIELGESVEEIFVNLAEPFHYNAETAEKEVFKREIPDVRSTFHVLNYKNFYKVTIQDKDLKLAFLSWGGVQDLIAKITDSMYKSEAYDELLVMKYMIGQAILKGQLYAVQVPTVQAENMKSIAATIKGVSNSLEFLSTDYNLNGVYNLSEKTNQFLISNAVFDATMDVEVLASSFNMDKAEFMGHRILVDKFGNLDVARLNKLLGDNVGYVEPSQDEMDALNTIPAVLVDRDWFMIFDNLYEFTENYNGQGLYWNYFYHVWKTVSFSPYANATIFVPGKPDVTSVTVSPASVTASAGQTIQFSATTATTNFAPQSVDWSTDSDEATVNYQGIVTLSPTATGTINVTATSTYNPLITGSAKITIPEA